MFNYKISQAYRRFFSIILPITLSLLSQSAVCSDHADININAGAINQEAVIKHLTDLDLKNDIYKMETKHVLDRHVGKSEKWLLSRLEKKKLEEVGSYTDIELANKAIAKVIEKNIDEIKQWLDLKKNIAARKAYFEYDLKEEIGYGIKKGESKSSPRTKAVVVLKREKDGNVRFLTSYPK